MTIRPIRSSSDHEAALCRVTELWGAADGSPEADELDVWVTLIDAWESANQPIDPPTPVEALRFRMEQQGLQRADLVAILGSRSRASEVLSGKRGLSLAMIRRLHAQLGIPAEVLIAQRGVPSAA